MSRKSLFFTSLSVFFTTLILLVLFLPALLSRPFLYPFSKRVLSSFVGAKVDFEELKLSWLGRNRIKSPSAQASKWSFNGQEINTTHGLLRIWWMKDFGLVAIDKPYLHVSMQKKSTRAPQKTRSKFYGKGIIRNGKIEIEQENDELVQFIELKAVITHLDQVSPWQVKASGVTQDNDTSGNFSIYADIPDNLFEDSSFQLNAKIKKVPTDILDVFFLDLLPMEFQSWSELLGTRFSLNVESTHQEQNLITHASLVAPFVFIDSHFSVNKRTISSKHESILQCNFHESTLNRLYQKLGFSLPGFNERNLFARLSIQKFEIPIREKSINWKKAFYEGSLSGRSQGALKIDGSLKNYNFLIEESSISTTNFEKAIQLSGKAELKIEDNELCKTSFSFQIHDVFHKFQLLQPQIRLTNFPLVLMHQLIDYPIVDLIGPSISLRVDERGSKFLAKVYSNRGVIGPAQFSWTDGLQLLEEMPFSWRLRPFGVSGDFTITNGLELKGSISELSFQDNEIKHFQAGAEATNIHLNSSVGICEITKPSATLRWDVTDKLMRFNGAINAKNQNSLLSLLFGNQTDFVTTITKKNTNSSSILVDCSGGTLNGKAAFLLSPKTISLKNTSNIQFSPDPSSLVKYLKTINVSIPALQSAPNFSMELESLSLPLSNEASLEFALTGTTKNENLAFLINHQKEVIKSLSIGLKQKEDFSLDLSIETPDERKSQIEIRESLNAFYLDASLNQIPSSLIESFMDYSIPLKDLVGNEISGSFRVDSNAQKKTLSCDCYAEKAKVSFGYQSRENSATLIKPFRFDGTLDLQAYRTLFPEFAGEYTLKKPTDLSLDVSKYEGKELFKETFSFLDFFNGICKGSLTFKNFQIENQQSQFIDLKSANVEWNKKRETVPLEMSLSAKVDSGGENYTLPGDIQGNFRLENWLNPQGQIAWKTLSSNGSIHLKNVPTSLIDLYYLRAEIIPPSTLFGRLLSATIDMHIQNAEGNFSANINASDFHGDLHGYLQDGYLTLKKPLRAYWTISPRVSQLLLENMNIDYISAKKPIELTISPSGFRFPLYNFNLRNANIRHGRLDLGQLRCYNRGNPQDISSLFELNLTSSNVIALWFAPMDFHMQSGLLEIERTEILFDNRYDIAVWGDVNLTNRNVKMNLGLTAQSLREALGITNLPDDYVLRIPFKGTIGDVRIDRATAAAKIALLVARQTGQSSDSIWGGFIGAIGELADDQSSIPPAKHPFPWEKQ